MNNKCIIESILDEPRETLCPDVWNIEQNTPTLTNEAQRKIDDIISWIQDQYHFNNLSVYIIGSICSNSYSDNSDIDVDFCASNATKDDNNEDAVREFGWQLKKNFIDNYAKDDEKSKIGTHPIEVYFSPNPFQCFMSIGCYNVLERKWEVGPDLKDISFDPVSKYYAKAMKQVDKILKDIRNIIFELYENAFVCKKSNDAKFKATQVKNIISKIDNASDLFDKMRNVRANFQKPCKSKEEALKRRNNVQQHIVDASFKFLDKFGYISILKDIVQLKYDIEEGRIDANDDTAICDAILNTISSNMQLKHLQDSEAPEDQKFLSMLQENDMLEESTSSYAKMMFIAGLMAIGSFLPVNALTKNLTKACKQTSHLTINSPEAKKAIDDSAKDNPMVGPMHKTNVVNALARLLWLEARGQGSKEIQAVAVVINNRTGNDPSYIIDVIKKNAMFSCMESYTGGWTDETYEWYSPWKAIAGNKSNKAIWDECCKIALEVVEKRFAADDDVQNKIGNRNAYLNKKKARKWAVNTWGKKCDVNIGPHSFGYLREYDPKYVVPGTFTSWKKHNGAKKNAEKTIIVKNGDTLSKIAKDNHTTIAKLLELNKDIKDPNAISVGQKIKVA